METNHENVHGRTVLDGSKGLRRKPRQQQHRRLAPTVRQPSFCERRSWRVEQYLPLDEAVDMAVFVIVSGSDGLAETLL